MTMKMIACLTIAMIVVSTVDCCNDRRPSNRSLRIELAKRRSAGKYRPMADRQSNDGRAGHLERFEGMILKTGEYEEGFKWIIKEVLALGNMQFVGEVFVGYNQSSYLMIFDTGSNFPWLPHMESNLIPKSGEDQFGYSRKGFRCADSPSCYIDETHLNWFEFVYGKGNTRGVIVEEILSLGSGFDVNNTQILLALEGIGKFQSFQTWKDFLRTESWDWATIQKY